MTFIQRFGSALNLNIHLHMLVLDGAYTFAHDRARFHHAPAPSDAELIRLLKISLAGAVRPGPVSLLAWNKHPSLKPQISNSPIPRQLTHLRL